MRGRVNAIRTFKGLVADLRFTKFYGLEVEGMYFSAFDEWWDNTLYTLNLNSMFNIYEVIGISFKPFIGVGMSCIGGYLDYVTRPQAQLGMQVSYKFSKHWSVDGKYKWLTSWIRSEEEYVNEHGFDAEKNHYLRSNILTLGVTYNF